MVPLGVGGIGGLGLEHCTSGTLRIRGLLHRGTVGTLGRILPACPFFARGKQKFVNAHAFGFIAAQLMHARLRISPCTEQCLETVLYSVCSLEAEAICME